MKLRINKPDKPDTLLLTLMITIGLLGLQIVFTAPDRLREIADNRFIFLIIMGIVYALIVRLVIYLTFMKQK